jgi:hypothetical protein
VLLICWGPVPGFAYGFPVLLVYLFSQVCKRAALVAVRWRGAVEGPQGWLFMVLSLTLV